MIMILKRIVTALIIYSVFIPLVILDIWMELYHRSCFPVYDIPVIKRSNYIKIDRHKLSQLNFIQKLGCIYCGYGNGLVAYWTKIIAETENYWCPIQHKEDGEFIAPAHHKSFDKYGKNADVAKNRKPYV
ncbi:hypothetical protein ACFL14_01625 [Patescibacteria group bacterium]